MTTAIHYGAAAYTPRQTDTYKPPVSADSTPAAALVDALQGVLATLEQAAADAQEVKRRLDERRGARQEAGKDPAIQKRQATGHLMARLRSADSSAAALNSLRTLPGLLQQVDPGSPTPDYSHMEFYEQLMKMMGLLEGEWLDKYGDAMQNYIEFFKRFTDIMAGLKDAISAGEDGEIKVDFAALRGKIYALIVDYGSLVLARFPNEAAGQAFIDDLGLTGLQLIKSKDGDWVVQIDTSPLSALHGSMPGTAQTWDTAKYNAWLSGKDANTEQLQHVSQVLAEKLSRITQLFDNLMKVLSASIESISEADKAFINNL